MEQEIVECLRDIHKELRLLRIIEAEKMLQLVAFENGDDVDEVSMEFFLGLLDMNISEETIRQLQDEMMEGM